MNKATSIFILICMTLLCVVGYVQADNVRPAYLGIENFKEGRYKITWKNPLKNGEQLPIAPVLPASFKKISPRTVTKTGDAVIHKWMVSSEGQVLDGQKISINVEGNVLKFLLTSDCTTAGISYEC